MRNTRTDYLDYSTKPIPILFFVTVEAASTKNLNVAIHRPYLQYYKEAS